MPGTDLQRSCGAIVEEYLSAFRVVILNGPRQSGKTTLLRQLHDHHGGTVLNLDDEQVLQAAVSDPVAFASSGAEPRFIDEVQRAGDPLVRAVKTEKERGATPSSASTTGG